MSISYLQIFYQESVLWKFNYTQNLVLDSDIE